MSSEGGVAGCSFSSISGVYLFQNRDFKAVLIFLYLDRPRGLRNNGKTKQYILYNKEYTRTIWKVASSWTISLEAAVCAWRYVNGKIRMESGLLLAIEFNGCQQLKDIKPKSITCVKHTKYRSVTKTPYLQSGRCSGRRFQISTFGGLPYLLSSSQQVCVTRRCRHTKCCCLLVNF